MKVFQMNDCDWWAGPDAVSTREAYLKEMYETGYIEGEDPEEYCWFEVVPVSDEEMETENFHCDDGGPKSFREELNLNLADGQPFPRFFATTEW